MRWGSLLLAAMLGGPVAGVVSAWEYRLSAAIAGHRVSLIAALRVTVVASVLNFLPGHGGALWRVQHLKGMGTRYRRATAVTLVMAFAWLGLAGFAAGILLLLGPGGTVPALLFNAMGVGGLVASAVLLQGPQPGPAAVHWGGWVLVVEACSIAVAAARLFVVAYALTLDMGVAAAVVFALAGILASATGILRAGLGLRELLAGAFAPLVGLPVALGFLVAAVDRLTGLVGRVPLALLLVLTRAPEDLEVEEATELKDIT